MQLAVRLAATLLALTWIPPVAQAATVLRDSALLDGIGSDPVPGSALIVVGGRIARVGSTTQLRIPAATTPQLRMYAAHGMTAAHDMGADHTTFDIRADQRKAQPEMSRVYTAGQDLVFKGCYAKTLVLQGSGFAHSVRDQPIGQALLDAMKRDGTAQLVA